MKAIKLMGLCCTVLFAVACNSNSSNNENDNTLETTDSTAAVVELETKIEVGLDSIKLEYQYDKNTLMKHGLCKEYSPDGKLFIERNYKQNKLDGVEKIYFPNGKIDGQFTYKDGLHHGAFVYYDEESGKVKQEGEYVNGEIEGILKSYYPDGTLKEEVMHVAGLTQGEFKEYNENGSLKAAGTFTSKSDRENLEEGLLSLYDENGELNQKMICKEGQCCTIWTKEDGDVKPSNKLCEGIIAAHNK